MNYRPLYLFFLISLLLFACNSKPEVQNKFSNALIREVHEAADARNVKLLSQYMKHPEVSVRAEAALCAGSMQSPELIELLKKMLGDGDENIRRNAAFSIGQSADEAAVRFLENAYHYQNSDEVKKEILVAIGKLLRNPDRFIEADTNNFSGFEIIEEQNIVFNLFSELSFSSEIIKEGYGLALQHFHRNKIYPYDLIKRLKFALQQSEPASRLAMVGAIASYQGPWIQENRDYFIQWIKQERNADIKFHLVKVIGNFQDKESIELVRGFASTRNADIRINISALGVLSKNPSLHEDALMNCLKHPNDHVVALAIEALGNAKQKIKTQEINDAVNGRSKFIQAKVLALLLSENDTDALNEWLDKFNSEKNAHNKMLFAQAASRCKSCLQPLRAAFDQSTDPVVLYGLTEAILSNYNEFYSNKGEEYSSFLEKAFLKKDDGVIDLCTSALENTPLSIAERNAWLERIGPIRQALKLPQQTEVYNHLTAFMNSIDDGARENAPIDFIQKINWDYIATLTNEDVIELETSKGIVRMQLNLNDAPGSVAFIANLVEEGYYNGKSFHRIIPNFVAQGGCPIGTGMGSTAFPIRSEFSLNHFQRGSVGLASAGKDTENCQFFINYKETPHLDGRYTVFAQVIEGIEVLDELIIGDTIVQAKVIRKSN